MNITVYLLDSFVSPQGGGNPAGVVLDADTLSGSDMQNITKKVGFSETVFITKSHQATAKTRFFTPETEIDLCGHATIAAFAFLYHLKKLTSGHFSQETKSGILGIEIKSDGSVFMEQAPPQFHDTLPAPAIAPSLGLRVQDVHSSLPIQIVSTGVKDIIIPLRSLATLNAIKPNFDEIVRISKKYDAIGYHAFTLETLHNSSAHCRNFAPSCGIPEESATGTSSGALACYLYHYGPGDKKQASALSFEQGYILNSPSEILANLELSDGEIQQVYVGGKAITKQTKIIEI